MLQNAIREMLAMDWRQSRATTSVPCTLAIAIALIAGFALHQPMAGMVAASGAMSVGFGAFQRLGRSRFQPMFWATIGMVVFTALGSVAGHSLVGTVVNAVIVGLFYGIMTGVSGGAAWISLQCGIFAIVATGYPSTLRQALVRAALILTGGFLQILSVVVFRRLHIKLVANVPADAFGGVSSSLKTLEEHWRARSQEFRYAIRLAATLAIAAFFARVFAFPNGYWIPMTALVVLRTRLHETLTRGVARIAGTLIGAVLATVIVTSLRPDGIVLAALVVLCAWLSYSTVNVSYGTFAASVTAYIVFLLAFGGLSEREVALHRIVATCLGGGIALLAATLGPRTARNATVK